MADRLTGLSLQFERALRLSASGHRDQLRKSSGVPYVEHPVAVALLLDRAGFDEAIVIAGLLHDLVEDTEITLDRIRQDFSEEVASIVGACSEVKLDVDGKKRPWIDRKRDHLAEAAQSSEAVRAVILADKLHNLISIKVDLLDGLNVWSTFNAGRDQVLWYYEAMLNACRSEDSRLAHLSNECRSLLAEVARLGTSPEIL